MDEKKNKKCFAIPEAEIIVIDSKDIISLSDTAATLFWGQDDNKEDF